MLAEYRLRVLTAADHARVVDHRERMFLDGGRHRPERLRQMSQAFAEWLQPRLQDGRYFGWGLDDADAGCVASLGMMWLDWPPHPLHLAAGRAYLLNVFVEPAHRRLGLARRLAEHALAHARERGVEAAVLHPTAEAVALYQSLGFKTSSEMLWLSASAS